MAKSVRKALIELINAQEYEISQIHNDGHEEPYEGCEHSLLMAIEDDSTKVEVLKSSNPLCKSNVRTYMVTYKTLWGIFKILIW